MSLLNILGRIGSHIAVLLLAIAVEGIAFGEDSQTANAFLGPFLVASILPIWGRNISFKTRCIALGAGLVIATLFAATHLAILTLHEWPLVASTLAGLFVFVGLTVGWPTSKYIISWMPKPAILNSEEEPCIVATAPQDSAPATPVVASKELIAFRFLLLAWGVGLLILGYAVFCHLKAEELQQDVLAAYGGFEECYRHHDSSYCTSEGVIGSPAWVVQGIGVWRDLWANREEHSLYIGIAVVAVSSLLFYGIRWALTGRLRPLWPLAKQ